MFGVFSNVFKNTKVFIKTEKGYIEDPSIINIEIEFNTVANCPSIKIKRSETIDLEKKKHECYYNTWVIDPKDYLIEDMKIERNKKDEIEILNIYIHDYSWL